MLQSYFHLKIIMNSHLLYSTLESINYRFVKITISLLVQMLDFNFQAIRSCEVVLEVEIYLPLCITILLEMPGLK